MQWEITRARWNSFRMSKETTQACNCCFFVWSLSVTNIDFIWIQIGFAGRKNSVLVVIQRRCTCTLPLAQAWSQREFNFNLVVKLRNRNLYFKGIYSNLWIDMQWRNLNVHEWNEISLLFSCLRFSCTESCRCLVMTLIINGSPITGLPCADYSGNCIHERGDV